MTQQDKDDITSLVNYVFDDSYEYNDFIQHLYSEPYIVEEGILSQDEADTLQDDDDDAIINKAIANPKTNHIYAVACRLQKSLKL